MDTTNAYNNLKVAVIKDGTVTDIILVGPNDFESLKPDLINHYQATDLVVINPDCDECCRAGIGGTYDGTRFYPYKTHPSWVWDEDENTWVSPVGPSPALSGEPGSWVWDENMLNWRNEFATSEE